MKTLILVLAVLAGSGAAIAQVTPGSTYGLRGRGDIGPSNPSSGAATLDSLTVGQIDAGAIYNPGSANLGNGCLLLNGAGGWTQACTSQLGTNVNVLSGSNSILGWEQGFLRVGVGSFGTPQLYFSGDTNTGLYWIGADQIGVTTGGARSFSFDVVAGVLMGTTATTYLQSNASGSGIYNGSSFVNVTSNLASVTATSGLDLSTATPLTLGTKIIMKGTTPTISSGFGTSPSVSAGTTTASFRVNVGTGGTATSGVIALNATATAGWNCFCSDITTNSLTVFNCKQTASTTTTATIGQFSATTGVASAWVASDILAVSCFGY